MELKIKLYHHFINAHANGSYTSEKQGYSIWDFL
jgi:hypothetical protein